jgi:hypothetical protein
VALFFSWPSPVITEELAREKEAACFGLSHISGFLSSLLNAWTIDVKMGFFLVFCELGDNFKPQFAFQQ